MNFAKQLQQYRELILPISIISCIVVILVPLPTMVMDLLLSANIAISVIVLLTTIYIKTPLEFNIFPSLLVATTLGRLVLNVATTRLILTRADTDSLEAAGGVIQAFGQFVAGDRTAVGIIIFVIIVLIQFLVITKGATRVSEVAARFALDGMPGRQMSIDADLNSGAIDEAEAQRRRENLTSQADFYGAMDGASKFVRGDAVAGILITLINIAGGLFVGIFYAGLDIGQAFELFTTLTIGDGLVSQVPAFLISLAAALLVTRSTAKTNLPTEFLAQLLSRPQALAVAGGFLGLLIFTQLPTLPLLTLGGGCIGLSFMIAKQTREDEIREQAAEAQAEVEKAQPPEPEPADYLNVDAMRLSLGGKLLALANPAEGGELLPKIKGVRSTIASEMGILLPRIRLQDQLELPEHAYVIQIAGDDVATGQVLPGRILAVASGPVTGSLQDGIATTDPVLGNQAFWIREDQKLQAQLYGFDVATPEMVIATHIEDIGRRYADELLTRDVTKTIIDQLKEHSPTVVDELIPAVMKLSDVQGVLQNLLREDIPIRQLGLILETLGDYASRIKDPLLLTDAVRNRLARTISQRFSDTSGQLHVLTIDPAVEDRIAAGVQITDRGMQVRMSPQVIDMTCRQIAEQLPKLTDAGHPPVLLVNQRIRSALRRITESQLPHLRILSFSELTRQTTPVSVGLVTDPVSA